MALMLPDELVWVLQKLGFEWPDIDEDELRRGAEIVRTFETDMLPVVTDVRLEQVPQPRRARDVLRN